jgi:Zn2+/Cd2+-exporting ATPase
MEEQKNTVKVKYQIGGMDCANCALTLERSLGQLPGVEHIRVNFTTASLEAAGEFDPQAMQQRVQALGYQVLDEAPTLEKANAGVPGGDGPVGFFRYMLSDRHTAIILILAGVLLVSTLLGWGIAGWVGTAWLLKAVHFSVVALGGYPILLKGIRALVFGRQITIDLLMSIATIGAIFIGETGEAATVIILFAIGESLEGYSAARARDSLRSLLALKPETATVLRPCMDCAEHMGIDGYTGGPCPVCGTHQTIVPIEAVHVGETVLVRPGERIPVDGTILNGASSVNQAPVTGESLPVLKQTGDGVFAGTLNGEGALEVQVTQPARDSTISRIVRLVEQAQAQRAPVERFIDRFAAWYTPLVVVSAALLAVVPPVFFAQPFFDLADGTRGWLYRALALLIVACPCALVISTPVTMVSALTGLARRGVLVKGGTFLDVLARVRVFAYDKTGTLTTGKPVVVQTRTLDCQDDLELCQACDDMLVLAAAVESRSEHPLAQAVLAETQERRIAHRIPVASQVKALAGRGVQGNVNGRQMAVSSHNHGHENYIEHADLHERIEQAEAEGQTVMLVSQDDRVIGFLGVADALRQSGVEALAELKRVDPRIHTVMLTGDHPAAAKRIAEKIPALDEVKAGLLPEDKLETVQSLRKQYGTVAMIGDGVNDAPALAAASVGIAMGGAGTAQAMETADVLLMQDDLSHLPGLVRTSRRSREIIWQNIIFSLGLKALFLVLTLPGWATLWMAVFADMGASLLVTLNGMRALREK